MACHASNISISDQYRAPLQTALVVSLGMAIISLLMLDFGQSARLTAIALSIFWLSVAIAITKRPNCPIANDLLFIRWASVPLVIGFQAATHLAWQWRGLE